MIMRILFLLKSLVQREDVLLLSLIALLLFYWTMAFVLPPGSELVAYQRY